MEKGRGDEGRQEKTEGRRAMSTALQAGDYATLAGILMTCVGAPLGLLIAQTRSMHRENRQALAEIRADVARLDERLVGVETQKVSHGDWVRVTQSQVSRLNRMSEQMAELGGKLDATIGIAPGVQRIADAISRRAEAVGES
jgi:hypothetical protein